jgi:hypothetical protein
MMMEEIENLSKSQLGKGRIGYVDARNFKELLSAKKLPA